MTSQQACSPLEPDLANDCKQRIAALDYELAVAAKEREAAEGMADQLREELARLGKHIRWYGERNEKLDAKRQALRQQVAQLQAQKDATRRAALLLRELALVMHRYVEWGLIELGVENGAPVVELNARRAFRGAASELSWKGRRALKSLRKIVESSSRAILIRTVEGDEASPERMQAVADFLVARGLSRGRVKLGETVPARGSSQRGPESREAEMLAPRIALVLMREESDDAEPKRQPPEASSPQLAGEGKTDSGQPAPRPEARLEQKPLD